MAHPLLKKNLVDDFLNRNAWEMQKVDCTSQSPRKPQAELPVERHEFLKNKYYMGVVYGVLSAVLFLAAAHNAISTTLGANPAIAANVEADVTLLINGNGTVAPALSGRTFFIGKKYTLTAAPAKGWMF